MGKWKNGGRLMAGKTAELSDLSTGVAGIITKVASGGSGRAIRA